MEIPYTVREREDTGLYNAKLGIWLFLASEVMLFGALFSSYILLRVGAAPGTWPHHLLNVPLGTLNTIVLILSSVTVVLSWAFLKMNQFGKYRITQAVTILCAAIFIGIKSFEYRDKFNHYEIIKNDGTVVDGHLLERTKDYVLIHPTPPHRESAMEKQAEAKEASANPSAAKSPEAAGATHEQKSAEAQAAANKEGASAAHTAGAEAHGEGEHAVKVMTADIKKMENYGPWHNTYLAIYFTLTGLHALHVIGGALVIFYIWGPGARMWKTEPERYTNRVEVSGLFWHFVDLVWIFLFPVLYLL
jgi:cytochrome c oxidase subunit 3